LSSASTRATKKRFASPAASQVARRQDAALEDGVKPDIEELRPARAAGGLDFGEDGFSVDG